VDSFFPDTVYVRGDGEGGEWATDWVYKNFSLTIECPDVVRVWKVALRGRDSNTQRIFQWRIEGSDDGRDFTALFRVPNPTYLGNTIQHYEIDTNSKFIYYRLYCKEAEPQRAGLSYMQFYIYSD